MESVRKIKLSKKEFSVYMDNSSFKLNYVNEPDAYVVDISEMNLINAVKIAILCSTYCFIKNFKKNIRWIVQDDEIKNAISILRLKNIEKSLVAKIDNESAVLV